MDNILFFLLRGVFYASAFAVLETLFRCVVEENENGEIYFHPNLQGRSTWAMFFGVCFGGVYILEPSLRLMTYVGLPIYVRLLCWPLIIWAFEMLWGWFLFYHCNQTRAWHYKGKAARCNGFIKLTYFPFWVLIGAAIEIFIALFVRSTII